MKYCKSVLVLLCLGLVAPVTHASVIVENTDATDSDPGIYGQVFTTPDDGIADVLESFTWFGPDGSTAIGGGRVYLFDSEYLGTPDALSAASFLAQSAIYSGSEYSFLASTPILDPNTIYYVYSDTLLDVGYRFGSGPGHYWAGGSGASNFRNFDGTTNYRAEGSAVPEPTTLALMTLGLAGIGYRRHRSKTAA